MCPSRCWKGGVSRTPGRRGAVSCRAVVVGFDFASARAPISRPRRRSGRR